MLLNKPDKKKKRAKRAANCSHGWDQWRQQLLPSLLIFNKHGRLVTHFSFRQIGLQHFIPIFSFAKQTALPAAEHTVPSQSTTALPQPRGCHNTRALPWGQERGTGGGQEVCTANSLKTPLKVQLSADPQDPDEDTRPSLDPLPTSPSSYP